MKDFKKPGSFEGKRGGNNFGRSNTGRQPFHTRNQPRRGRDDGFGRSQMFEAVCANCGKKCEVPFRPNGQRPVYCRDCFGKQGRAPSSNFPKKDFGAQAPFHVPAPQEMSDGRIIDDIKRQLDAMSMKLDQLLNASRETRLPTRKPLTAEVEIVKETQKIKAPKGAKKKPSSKKQ